MSTRNQTEIGQRAVIEAAGNGGSTLETLQGLAHCANQVSSVDIFAGAVGAVATIFQNLKSQGLPVPNFKDQYLKGFLTQAPAAMAATLSANLSTRHEHGGPMVAALCVAVDQYRGKMSFDSPVATVEPTKPAPPPAPIEVVVISMPTRETETEIQRNRSGQIESTRQVERDA